MTDHRIDVATFPPFRSGLPAIVLCLCGHTVTEPPKAHLADPHQPAADAYDQHLTAQGFIRKKGRNIGNDHGPSAWKRMAIK